jgi:hypothetical protein
MLGGTLSVCDDATLTGPERATAVLPLASRIESRIPGFRTLADGSANCSGVDFSAVTGGAISGIACCECAKKDSEVNHM